MGWEKTLLRQTLHTLIDELTPAQRAVTLLFYVEGYSQQEVAEKLCWDMCYVVRSVFLRGFEDRFDRFRGL